MRYINPETVTLSIIQSDINYKKTVYEKPLDIQGVTDESYDNYDSSTTYNTGDYVIVPELKTFYRCAADNVSGVFPPSDGTKWIDYGFINSYKMLSTDEEIGAQTIGQDIYLKIDFTAKDTLGLINVSFSSLLLEEIDEDSGYITNESVGTGDGSTTEFYLVNENVVDKSETIYKNGTALTRDTDYTIDYFEGKIIFSTAPVDGDSITADYTKATIKETIAGRDFGVNTFAEYFYLPFQEKTRVIARDLAWLPNATLNLTFTGISTGTKIGTLVTGSADDLGITLMGTSLTFEDRSKIKNDEFTNTRQVIRYGHVRVLNGKVLFHNNDFDLTAQKINNIIGKNILFVPDETDKFSEMTNIAYIESFEMPIENPVVFNSTITLIGVA